MLVAISHLRKHKLVEKISQRLKNLAAGLNATQTNETNLNLNNGNFGKQNDYLSANPPTVSTSGTSTTEVRPDQASVTVGVETNGTTAQEAVSQNANLDSTGNNSSYRIRH